MSTEPSATFVPRGRGTYRSCRTTASTRETRRVHQIKPSDPFPIGDTGCAHLRSSVALQPCGAGFVGPWFFLSARMRLRSICTVIKRFLVADVWHHSAVNGAENIRVVRTINPSDSDSDSAGSGTPFEIAVPRCRWIYVRPRRSTKKSQRKNITHRIRADRETNWSTNTTPRRETDPTETGRTQYLRCERLAGLCLLCAASPSFACCCAVPSTKSSTSAEPSQLVRN